jgi:outer membrane biosynthesis protein TonB
MPDQREPRSVLESAEKAAASGDFASAEQLLREAARLQEASLGPLHPDLANTLNNLGVVCEVAEKPAEAERYFRRAYDIAMASLDPDHPFVATSRQNLEDFCAAKGLDVVVRVPLPAPVPPPAPSPPPVLAPSPAKTIQKRPRLEPRATVRPEPAIHEETHSAPAKTPSRALMIGALLSAGLLVTLLAAPWFRSNDAPGSSAPPAAQPPAASPAKTESPKPPETQAAKPAETSPAEPKSSEAPQTPVARQPDPAMTARATAGMSKSALIVVDASVCKDLQVTGNWRCESPSRPVAPGRLVFYTRIKSPTNAKILHRWYQGDRLRQAMELIIRANPGSGYRTFSRLTVNSGEWRVELRASDGTLLREERFTVR